MQERNKIVDLRVRQITRLNVDLGRQALKLPAILERVARADVPVRVEAREGDVVAGYLASALSSEEGSAWRLPRVDESGLLRFGALVFAASMVSEDLASLGVGLLPGQERDATA